jgi:polyvinyl alcohol dehydrogenase (cytochrome)
MMQSTIRFAAPAVLVLVTLGCSQPAPQSTPSAATTTPAATTVATPPTAGSAEHPGKAVYDRACASCHNNPEATRAPALDALRQMRFTNVNYALTEGKMKLQAASLSDEERKAVADFLTGTTQANDAWIAKMMCPADRRTVDLRPAASVAGFGFDAHNHRHLTRAQTGIATADFADLELAWSIAFPQATTMRSQPAIVGNTLFFPAGESSQLLAIDVGQREPCLKWVYNSDLPLRTSAAYGDIGGRKVLAVGDVAANVHLIDALTGAKIWTQSVRLFPLSLTTGTPIIHDDRVYAPISQYEITVGGNDDHECCKTHGAVVALDGKTGAKLWTAHTMEDARPVRDRGDGKMIWGPSGAPIWNSPAIDAKRGLLFVGTGEATSEPAAKTTDSVLAIDLKDGSIRWHFQATENDIFLTGCPAVAPRAAASEGTAAPARRRGLNCPLESVTRDVDFGASVILGTLANGQDVLFAGQKAGTLWALNRDDGKVLWRQDFGDGSPLGGIHWGIAFDGERVYAPINRPYGSRALDGAQRSQKPGIHAVEATTGKVLWTFAAEPDCSGDRQARVRGCSNNIGLSGAPTVIDGAVVAGALDGYLRVFDAQTGAVLFSYDTAKKFDTINGVAGHGGAIDNASIVAANGQLFVASGYGMFGQPPGNVLLAFRPKGK